MFGNVIVMHDYSRKKKLFETYGHGLLNNSASTTLVCAKFNFFEIIVFHQIIP